MHIGSVAVECYQELGHLAWDLRPAPLLSPLSALTGKEVSVPQVTCVSDLAAIMPVIQVASDLSDILVIRTPPEDLFEYYDTLERVAFDIAAIQEIRSAHGEGGSMKHNSGPVFVSLFGTQTNNGLAIKKGFKNWSSSEVNLVTGKLLSVSDSLRLSDKRVKHLRVAMKGTAGRVKTTLELLRAELGEQEPTDTWAQIMSMLFPSDESTSFTVRSTNFRKTILEEVQELRQILDLAEKSLLASEQDVRDTLNSLNTALMKVQASMEPKKGKKSLESDLNAPETRKGNKNGEPSSSDQPQEGEGVIEHLFGMLFTSKSKKHIREGVESVKPIEKDESPTESHIPDPDPSKEHRENVAKDKGQNALSLLTTAEENAKSARRAVRQLSDWLNHVEAMLHATRDASVQYEKKYRGGNPKMGSGSVSQWKHVRRETVHQKVKTVHALYDQGSTGDQQQHQGKMDILKDRILHEFTIGDRNHEEESLLEDDSLQI
jgi:hypothetical protein